MSENELSKIIVDTAFKIHTSLGPGLLESLYEEILVYELKKQGIFVEQQLVIPVVWDNQTMKTKYRCDLLVENKLIIEVKASNAIEDVHLKQLLTYLKISNTKLGLLINFNEELIKTGIRRVVNGLEDDSK